MKKKFKLLSTLAIGGVIGSTVPVVSTSCSTFTTDTTNSIVYEGKVYELANNFNPNFLCGDIFLIPLKDGRILPVISIFKALISKITLNVTNQRVTTLGDHFLEGCIGLTNKDSLDLSGLKNVTSVGSFFLANCSQLKEIDLSPMTSLQHIGPGFAYQCNNSTKVNTGYLDIDNFDESNYTFATDESSARCYGCAIEIEGDYKYNIVLKFKELNGEDNLYRYLVYQPKNLIMVNKNGVITRYEIEENAGFDDYCNNGVNVFNILLKGQTTKTQFNCEDVINLSFRDLGDNLTAVPANYLSNCPSLINVLWEDYPTITSIGNNFLDGCVSFNYIDISPFANVTTIGDNFLGQTNILYCDMSCLNDPLNIKIGYNFLSKCNFLLGVNMGDIQPDSLAGADNESDRSFAANNNITAWSAVLGTLIIGSAKSKYVGAFPNGMTGSLTDLWIRNIHIITII